MDNIFVLLAYNAIARVEICWHLSGIQDSNILRQMRVHRTRYALCRNAFGQVLLTLFANRCTKAARVNATVGAAAAHDIAGIAKKGLCGFIQHFLHGNAVWLHLIAAIGGSLIRNR